MVRKSIPSVRSSTVRWIVTFVLLGVASLSFALSAQKKTSPSTSTLSIVSLKVTPSTVAGLNPLPIATVIISGPAGPLGENVSFTWYDPILKSGENDNTTIQEGQNSISLYLDDIPAVTSQEVITVTASLGSSSVTTQL